MSKWFLSGTLVLVPVFVWSLVFAGLLPSWLVGVLPTAGCGISALMVLLRPFDR
jgi:hypothetical protein